eukprot:4164241-Amphidinium_carterae.1
MMMPRAALEVAVLGGWRQRLDVGQKGCVTKATRLLRAAHSFSPIARKPQRDCSQCDARRN